MFDEKFLILAVYTVLVIVLAVILKVRGKKTTQHFDEMQERHRAEGYKWAFFSLVSIIGGICAYTSIFEQEISNYILGSILIAALMVSLIVFGLFCICNDSFFFIGQNWRIYFLLCLVAGGTHLLNAVSAISFLMKNDTSSELIREGYISKVISSGSIAVTFLTLLVAITIKMFQDKKSGEE